LSTTMVDPLAVMAPSAAVPPTAPTNVTVPVLVLVVSANVPSIVLLKLMLPEPVLVIVGVLASSVNALLKLILPLVVCVVLLPSPIEAVGVTFIEIAPVVAVTCALLSMRMPYNVPPPAVPDSVVAPVAAWIDVVLFVVR